MIAEGGPLAWLDTLLGARNERLEAELDHARNQARESRMAMRAAIEEAAVAQSEAAGLRQEVALASEALQTAEQARRAAEAALARARRAADRERDDLTRRIQEATADRTWDIVRRMEEHARDLQEQLDECGREHGHA